MRCDLDELMVSGDLEIHAEDVRNAAGAGAADVDIRASRTSVGGVIGALPRELPRKVKPADPYIVMTLPLVTSTTDNWEVRGSVTVGSGADARTFEAQPRLVAGLHTGEVRRVDLCAVRLQLTSDMPIVPADGRTR